MEKALPHFEQPAQPSEVALMVSVLLEPYFSRDTDPAVKRAEIAMWCDGLSQPLWAVRKAVSWWHGPNNADRRRRPVWGDIAARAAVEMGPIEAARIYLALPLVEPEPPREEMTREALDARRAAAAQIVAGFAARAKK